MVHGFVPPLFAHAAVEEHSRAENASTLPEKTGERARLSCDLNETRPGGWEAHGSVVRANQSWQQAARQRRAMPRVRCLCTQRNCWARRLRDAALQSHCKSGTLFEVWKARFVPRGRSASLPPRGKGAVPLHRHWLSPVTPCARAPARHKKSCRQALALELNGSAFVCTARPCTILFRELLWAKAPNLRAGCHFSGLTLGNAPADSMVLEDRILPFAPASLTLRFDRSHFAAVSSVGSWDRESDRLFRVNETILHLPAEAGHTLTGGPYSASTVSFIFEGELKLSAVSLDFAVADNQVLLHDIRNAKVTQMFCCVLYHSSQRLLPNSLSG